MRYIGLDVHKKMSSICILDDHGKKVKQMQVRGPVPEVLQVLRKIKKPFKICYEASCGYGYLYDRLRLIARQVVVAHPGQLRLIFRSKKKNDRIDAKKLATLLFLDQVPVVYVPSVRVRAWRGFIEFRHRVLGKRTRVKNGLRSLFRGHGIALPSGSRLWTSRGRVYLADADLPTSQAQLQRDLLLEELETFESQLKRAEKELNDIAKSHPGVQLLMSIPGVGPRTAEAVMAYIDDASRFTRNKQVGSYFGLVPCQDQSAEMNRLGHITREGPSLVRKLLVEAAWQGIRYSPRIRGYFEQVQGGDPNRKKIALVATAHYLVRVMQAMLRTGEGWLGDNQQQQVA
jgi:transposase